MTVSIYLQGGLGNQLFQIFALISYSLEHKIPFLLPEKLYDLNRNTYWDTLFKHLHKFVKKQTYDTYNILTEPYFHYNKIKEVNNDTLLMGYFQSYKYFINNYSNIRKLCGINIIKEQIRFNYNFNFNNTISMHFRFGDYLYLKNKYEILNYNYYFNSINAIISKIACNKLEILYFYEENSKHMVEDIINKLKPQFKDITFKPIYAYIFDYEQMLLMSLCRHNIIANSTFSWWGAYLNDNQDKIVTYPCKWFGNEFHDKNTRDLFPEEWIEINY